MPQVSFPVELRPLTYIFAFSQAKESSIRSAKEKNCKLLVINILLLLYVNQNLFLRVFLHSFHVLVLIYFSECKYASVLFSSYCLY